MASLCKCYIPNGTDTLADFLGSNEQQTTLHGLTNPFELEPEIYGTHTFILDKKFDILSTAENLKFDATYLIKILESIQPANLREQFQIGVRKTNNTDCSEYRIVLRIDPVLWFKNHPLNNGNEQDLKQLHELGLQYVAKVKKETEHYPPVEDEESIKRIAITNSIINEWCETDRKGKDCPLRNDSRAPCKYKHYTWCFDENCGTNGMCNSISDYRHKTKFLHFSQIDKEPLIYNCRCQFTNLKRRTVSCGFHIDPNFLIYNGTVENPSHCPYFVVAARSNAIPVITLTPIKHCSNKEYVQTLDAWQAVLKTLIYMKEKLQLKHSPLNSIYINFGKWMQQKADDSSRRSCHAHINIVLSRETIEKIIELHKSKGKNIKANQPFTSLVGSVIPPTSHRLDDSQKLIECMNDYMTPLLVKQYQESRRIISSLEDRIRTLEQDNERLNKLQNLHSRSGEEAEDTPPPNETADCGIGINDQTCA